MIATRLSGARGRTLVMRKLLGATPP